MGLFEAVSAAFATLPAGGFMPDNRLAGRFRGDRPVDRRRLHGARRRELRAHLPRVRRGAGPARARATRSFASTSCSLVVASVVLVAELWTEGSPPGEAAVRARRLPGRLDHDDDRASRASTTTSWTTLAVMTLIALMFVGGSAGSTSGSIKVVRHLLLGKSLRRELRQTLHPEEVIPIRLNGVVGRRAHAARGDVVHPPLPRHLHPRGRR